MVTRRALLGAGALALLAGCGPEEEPKVDAGAVLDEQLAPRRRVSSTPTTACPLAGALRRTPKRGVRRLDAALERFREDAGASSQQEPETGLEAALAAESAALRAHVAAVGQLEDREYRELLAGLVDRRRGQPVRAARSGSTARRSRPPSRASPSDAHRRTLRLSQATRRGALRAGGLALAATVLGPACGRGRDRRGRAPARAVAARDGGVARVRPASRTSTRCSSRCAATRPITPRRSRPSSRPSGSARRGRRSGRRSSTSTAERLARSEPDGAVAAAVALEEELVALYRNALPALPDAKIAMTAATILASHSQHLLILRRETGDG